MSYCYCLLSIECSASLWSVSAFLALWQCLLFVLHVLALALFERYSIRHRKGIMFAYCLCTRLDYPCHSHLDLCMDHLFFTIQRNIVRLCTYYLYICELSYYVYLCTASKLFVYYQQIICRIILEPAGLWRMTSGDQTESHGSRLCVTFPYLGGIFGSGQYFCSQKNNLKWGQQEKSESHWFDLI